MKNSTPLNGDLWGDNYAFLPDGTHPAPYFSDREADIAMTELFGGFDTEFMQPTRQMQLYKAMNLYDQYHILNHCNLWQQVLVLAEGMTQSLAEN